MTHHDETTIEELLPQETPTFHPILQVWREILAPATEEKTRRVTPQWATRIVTSYSGISFADMLDFRDIYFSRVSELSAILNAEIDTDDECLKVTTPEEDAQHNADHYYNVLADWQVHLLAWEMDWDCASDTAAVDVAVISEIHKMFFGQTGLTELLDQIPFEFTDMHRDALALALQAYKDGREEG